MASPINLHYVLPLYPLPPTPTYPPYTPYSYNRLAYVECFLIG